MSSAKRSSRPALKKVIKTKNNTTVVLETKKPVIKAEPEIRPPVIQQPVEVKETGGNVLITPHSNEPTPIFKDDTPKTKIEINYRPEKESNLVKNLGIGFFIIIGLFWLIIFILSISISFGPQEVEKNVTAIKYVGEKTSFATLVNMTDITYKEYTSVLGYLRKEIVSGGALNVTNNYVVDDYGNKIKVSFRYANISTAYDPLFPINKNTQKTYNVSGTYRFAFNTFILDVSGITAQDKKISEVKSIIVQNVTEGPSAGIRVNLATGMRKILNVFN